MKVEGYGSPTTLVVGEITDEALKIAASLCARYSDARDLSEIEVVGIKGNDTIKFRVHQRQMKLSKP